jgi:outer membrane protein assembly factor BamB
MDGWFRALDAHNGTVLWQFKTASGIVGDPITFKGPDGRQYIAIYSGIGGWMGVVAQDFMSVDDEYAALGVTGAMKSLKLASAPGDVLYVFGL